MGRPPIRKNRPFTNAERQHRYRIVRKRDRRTPGMGMVYGTRAYRNGSDRDGRNRSGPGKLRNRSKDSAGEAAFQQGGWRPLPNATLGKGCKLAVTSQFNPLNGSNPRTGALW